MSLGPLMVDIAGTELSGADRELLAHPLIGSVVLFARNYADPAQLQALCAQIRAVRNPSLLIAVDHEGGRVQRFRSGFSALPPLRRIGKVYDSDAQQGLTMARALGWLMAAELLACGLDFSFAPCVHGMRDAGMAATAKHFPGHGAVVADSHLALPVDRRELVDMEEDLLPYRRLIDNGLPAIMVAHVLFPAIDTVPASFSQRWIGQVLRQELRFGGLVFADDLSMAGAAAVGDLPARAERALAAGCDVLLVCNDRVAVERLLDEFKPTYDAAAQLRLIRMRGRKQLDFETLVASEQWRSAREWLERSAAKPELKFESGES